MNAQTERLLTQLIGLCRKISRGKYDDVRTLFELTKEETYPERVSELAESFGMMMVKVEAREYRMEQLIDDLKKIQEELSEAKGQLQRENVRLKQNLRRSYMPSRILGVSPEMRDLVEKVEKIADTPVNVLLTGETGTGKELVAKTLHYNSSRCNGPFVALNCSAIPETLFESEIFGIEKGVATGVERRVGKIEQADGGTLFLDEIGDMPLSGQSKILRVIEDRRFERVGSRKDVAVNIRIIAATNKNLRREMEKGAFREDLYYRLNVAGFRIPPLRERPDDVPVLLNHYLDEYARRLGKGRMVFSPGVVNSLKTYPWPGNVRELENEMERAVALAGGEKIALQDFSEDVRRATKQVGKGKKEDVSLQQLEKEQIEKVMAAVGRNKSEAARRLGLSREGLRRKMNRYGI